MKKVIVSTPGKLHLSGEHAVVHGKPAVLVSVSKRMYITLRSQITDHRSQGNIVEIKNKKNYLGKIIRLVEEKYQVKFSGFSLTISSDIPIGVGMGSSAALAVSLIGALSLWLEKPWNPTEINELAYCAERFQHGNPSGGDNTIITNGGILWFRKELEFLKTFWLLPFKIPKSFSPFVLIDTGRVEAAKDLIVETVGWLKNKNEKEFEWLMTRIEKVTRSMVDAIHNENETQMRECIKSNEKLLEEMGVVSKSTQKLIGEVEKIGGVAKISGAGGIKKGSGIVIVIHGKPQVILDIARKYRYNAFQTNLGTEGVKIEQVIV